tara:strand:- start:185 stop:553 length:369 start_codon:yes stop_codon:yes gene_type:complete
MKYFTTNEFDSPDYPNSGVNMDADFLTMLDNARDYAQISFKINSGYRTTEHNSKVGGKPKSSHLVGKAADISCNNSRERYIIFTALVKAGFNRIGIANSFIHVDSDGTDKGGEKSPNVIWKY